MTDTPKLLSREELDGLLESLRNHAAEGALGGSLFNEQKAVRAVRAHIAALEAERDALLEWQSKQAQDIVTLGLELSAAYARGLEDAAKVADELLSRANGAGSGRNWRDNPNYSGGEGISATAAAIAGAIRALKSASENAKSSKFLGASTTADVKAFRSINTELTQKITSSRDAARSYIRELEKSAGIFAEETQITKSTISAKYIELLYQASQTMKAIDYYDLNSNNSENCMSFTKVEKENRLAQTQLINYISENSKALLEMWND